MFESMSVLVLYYVYGIIVLIRYIKWYYDSYYIPYISVVYSMPK